MIRLPLLGLACALSACSPPEPARTDLGVCWRVREGAREVVDRDIANLQTCAVRLEAVRMMGGGEVEGAFEGRSIFVSEAAITQSPARNGTRHPVFEPAQRAEIQAGIRKLLDARAAAEARAR